MHRPFLRWLLPDTDRRIVKDRTGPDLDERPLYIEYVTEPGDFLRKNQTVLSPLAAVGPLTILSRPGALHTSGSRRACLMPIRRNACSLIALPDFPEFAQAVSYVCQFSEYLYSSKRILIRPVEAGLGRSLEHSWGCGWQRLSQPGVERFAQAKKPQELPDDLW